MTTYMRRVLKYDAVTGEFSVSMMVVNDDDANMNTAGLDSGDPATVVVDGRAPVQFEELTRPHIFTVQLAGGGTQNVSMAGFVDPVTGDSYFAPTGSFDVRTIASIDLYNEGLTTIFAEAYADYGFITVTPGAPGNNGGNHLVGTSGNDTIDALTGHDLVYGDDGDDTINGGNGQDDLYGGEGEDTLNGDANADRLFGGGDNDTMNGGAADDQLYGEDGDDSLNGGSGIDTFDGGEGSDTVDYSGTTDVGLIIDLHAGLMDDINFTVQETLISIENAVGGQLDDVFGATAAINSFDGQNGVDTVSYVYAPSGVVVDLHLTYNNTGWASGDAYASIENVTGTNFNDTLSGNSGGNFLRGLDGNDTLNGGAGADTLDGGSGIDTASWSGSTGTGVTVSLFTGQTLGSAAGDVLISIENLHGSGHQDSLIGDNSANMLNGLGGSDYLYGMNGNDWLIGHFGDDYLYGNEGDDDLDGGDGNDVLMGGDGADDMDGGDGIDAVDYSTSMTGVTISLSGDPGSGGAAGDTLSNMENFIGSDFNDVIGASAGANHFFGGAGTDLVSYKESEEAVYVNLQESQGSAGFAQGDSYTSIENVLGSGYDDLLVGDGAGNILQGQFGDDRLIGGAGADILDGGDDNDTADYSVEAVGVNINLLTNSASGGNAAGDTFSSVENLVGTAFADRLVGDRVSNRLEGLGGNDTIVGGAGSDTMYGGLGIDRLYGQDGNDSLSGNDGNDVIFAGIGADAVTGGEGNDSVNGNGGNDDISGGNGNDTLFGGGDQDVIQGGDGNDSIYGQAGDDDVDAGLVGGLGDDLIHGGGGNDLINGNDDADSLYGGAGNDFVYGGNDADYVHGGSGNDVLYGQAGDDNMFGFIGADTLNGGEGNDRLNGGDGNDTLRGGGGNDVLTGGRHDDSLWGEGGTDRFNFDDDWGHDVINDFANDGLEKINLAAVGGIASLADLTITNVVGEALITFGSNSIKVLGVQAAQLDSSDFIF